MILAASLIAGWFLSTFILGMIKDFIDEVGFFKPIVIVALIYIAFQMTACGDGGSTTSEEPEINLNQIAATYYSEEKLAEFKSNCIDANLPTIEADYQRCMSYVLAGTAQCAPERDRKIANLNRAWQNIVTELPGQIQMCDADWRTSPEWCDANIRGWLGHWSSFCSVSAM